ncbi:MAG: hypothetical protein A2677_01700 [Candidatus Komeilibacteria bacterium RIFCSPHIGHO2_01_FULL_52_14]|uniref:Vitamin K epoxide reductase domain-containing protein n=1 Tax=Candidatus Komeilibacteria bacterium RIFCSPHIGHO2_01_FULL_52_14 TaxID=1798549 RepID=A0A1G2BMK0_9BACT|nr:MAG: hypothetical protein A2677_01700 [Candidatus Komeilibacteria bacterium RIFCSPHIGHO2_01_FULL_52_14]
MRTPLVLKIQTAVLVAGTAFAWYTVVVDFVRFYGFEGTVFKVQDCIVPNPVTTPCFYGAWAFLIALIWTLRLLKRRVYSASGIRNLMLFLAAGTIFAFGNFGYGYMKFLANSGKPTVGCSGLLMTNPFFTPCFIGAMLFLASLIVSIVAWLSARNTVLPEQLSVR